jgi:hypothetical protein
LRQPNIGHQVLALARLGIRKRAAWRNTTIPLVGTLSFWQDIPGPTLVLVGLAMFGLLGALLRNRHLLIIFGGLSAIVSGWVFAYRYQEAEKNPLIQLGWGWGLLIIGGLLIAVAGFIPVTLGQNP